jgi:hypothetical protein
MPYKALTVIALPVLNEDGVSTGESTRYEPGAVISDEELAAAGQTEEDVTALVESGALSDDMDAELHPDHRPVPAAGTNLEAMIANAKEMVDRMGDEAPPEIKALAESTAVNAVPESGQGGDTNAG